MQSLSAPAFFVVGSYAKQRGILFVLYSRGNGVVYQGGDFLENGVKRERRRTQDVMLKSKSSWHTTLLLLSLTLTEVWHLRVLLGMVAISGRKAH